MSSRILALLLMASALLCSPAARPTTVQAQATPDAARVLRLGYSAENRPIDAWQFGAGIFHIVLVGGIHGGYEWNSALLAYRMRDVFTAAASHLPASITLTIIPAANPDGLYRVTQRTGPFTARDVRLPLEPGRFNGNGVDLNRNWDCNWQRTALWRGRSVPAGDAPFSEPEVQALRDFLLGHRPVAVVFWHSVADGVYAAGCGSPWLPSVQLAEHYGRASGYNVYRSFDFYQVTGDATDWLATQGIPGITVELSARDELDWQRNWRGVSDLLAAHDWPIR